MTAPDRKNALASQSPILVTGIDFIYVHPDHQTLDVFFLVSPFGVVPSLASLLASAVHIHSDVEGDLGVVSISWAVSDGRNVLRVSPVAPGGFSLYRLFIDDPRIDPFFNGAVFSFKAGCESMLDCEPPPHECPSEDPVDFPVDTMARDFWSLRRALLDFASQRYPDWKDRLEADVGVMLAEVLAHAGDEMSYYQDRVAREASLVSATQRRSLRKHARLVDYEVHDGLGAFAWLDVRVREQLPPLPQQLLAGTEVWATNDFGKRIPFEVGRGLSESLAAPIVAYDVRSQVNSLEPHIWDETATCLPAGATEMHLAGHHAANLAFDAPTDAPPGRWVLLATTPTDPSVPERRFIVRLLEVSDQTDPLVSHPVHGHSITRIRWGDEHALPFEMDLETLHVHGNVVPSTAGRTIEDRGFRAGDSSLPAVPSAIERLGPNRSPAYLFTLPDEDGAGLVWLGGDPRSARPEIRMFEATPAMLGPLLTWTDSPSDEWSWRRSLLGARSSRPGDRDFTLEDGTWKRAVGYQRLGGEFVHRDYLASIGTTIRFGDGEFGAVPPEDTWFHIYYRLGNGVRGNVPAESIRNIDPAISFVASVRNPLPATGGVDPELAADVRRAAPDEFKAVAYRAVTQGDYIEAAQRLPWVQRAGAEFRWTGSWLSARVTADPRGEPTLSRARRTELVDHLDRFRQAGREVHTLSPLYADLDLEIHVCVAPSAYQGDVLAAMTRALFGKGPRRRDQAFFHSDRFTFGTPLDRSELEAAVQNVPGVRAVEKVRIRRRAWFPWRDMNELVWPPKPNEVIRVENDRLHPERGTLSFVLHGGA